jgi:general secretion pathway protein F
MSLRYKYLAIDAQQQEVGGTLSAASEREAVRQLHKRGLTPLRLELAGQAELAGKSHGKPKKRDTLIVLHELATLLESGVSLIEAVESLAESGHHPGLTEIFAEIAAKLRHGVGFSVAVKQSALALPWYLPQLMEAGELTGKLAQSIRDGVAQMEYDTRIAEELRSAMIYPVILIFSGVSAVLLIFTLVVPKFANMLHNREADLPWLAQAVLSSGMFLNTYFYQVMAAFVLLSLGLAYVLGQAGARARLRDAALRLPRLGEWILEAETGRWAAMLGTLLENRVELLRALELSRLGIQLPSLQAKLDQVGKAVRAGVHLSQALHDNEALTSTGQNLIRAGERAGKLPPMLKSLARLYEESSRVRMKRFLLLIEPLAILLIGGAIGVIVTGIILAITSVNQINF